MNIYDLKVMNLKEPVIDKTPYFSWKIECDENNVLQEAYQISVWREGKVVWDSGKISSREQAYIAYEGDSLISRSSYRWTVIVWLNNGENSQASSKFDVAFMKKEDWVAKWIECPFERAPAYKYAFGNAYPPILFQKSFAITQEVKNAKIYATSYGVYQLQVNGTRPDNREFAPEFTFYEKTLYYQTYDVTKMIHNGQNNLSLYVGDGWYFSAQAALDMKEKHKEPSVLFQIELTYMDGTTELIYSDGSESCRTDFVEYSDLFEGEKQNFLSLERDSTPVCIKDYGYDCLCAQPMPPVRPVKLIPAKNIFTSTSGETIVDFGQVIAGRARIHIDVPKGQEVTFEYFEILDDNGNYINTMFASQKDIVISDGEPMEHEALFTFHGFRYLRVAGMTDLKKKDFTAVLLSTEKENTGTFTCSDKRMNRLYQNIRWSQSSNMMSIPTDCPTREKAGWTGDILIYAKTALLNEEVTPFLCSWLQSVRDSQESNGVVKAVAPYTRYYERLLSGISKTFGDESVTGIAGWSDAIVWVPYEMYQVTGNKLVLKENYSAMNKWCEYIVKTAAEKRGNKEIPAEYDQYLWNTGFHFGEWLVPSRKVDNETGFEICKESSCYIAPFFGYMSIRKMAEICGVLGKKEKQNQYKEIAGHMKRAIQEGILKRNDKNDYLMGKYVLAFAFDLVPEELEKKYKERLIQLMNDNGNCLDTGFLATPFILDTLFHIGEKKLAHEILWQNKQPSWLYEVDQGATTIWEAWDADEAGHTGRTVSFDHYAFGCVDDWICRHIAGIDSDTPGFSHIIIHPDRDGRLSSCERTFECNSGTIKVSWNMESMIVTIPCNTTATAIWNNTIHEIGSGTYEFC